MVWTFLHAALGETSSDLTYDMMERACAERIAEDTGLDWKRDLPLTATDKDAREAQQQEFAKDIAAMANSGGGLIVYGVDESRGTERSTAENIRSVGEIDDALLRTMRQVAGNLIYPAVTGVVMTPLTDDGRTVLAVAVPDSQSRPHLIRPAKSKGEWFAAPWRDGPHTNWMSERQLADEYRLRDRGHQLRREQLNAVWDSALQVCGVVSEHQWVIAVLQPEQSRRISRDLLPARAEKAILWAQANVQQVVDHGGGFGISAITVTEGHEIRRGLQMRYRATLPGSNVNGRFEVHADGTVVLAVHRPVVGFRRATASGNDVAICDIEQVGLDVVTALLATRHRFGVTSGYTLRLGVAPGTEVFRRTTPGMPGQFNVWDEGDRVANFRTVEGTVSTDSRDSAVTDIVELVQDAVHQTGAVPSLMPANVLAQIEAD